MEINSSANSDLDLSFVSVPSTVAVPDSMNGWAHQFQEAMMKYTCAIREVKTKLEVLNDELSRPFVLHLKGSRHRHLVTRSAYIYRLFVNRQLLCPYGTNRQ